jgi:hypothetical protein
LGLSRLELVDKRHDARGQAACGRVDVRCSGRNEPYGSARYVFSNT